MKSYDKRWLVIKCDSDFIITDIVTIKNIETNLKINDDVSKIISRFDIQKFIDFTLTLKNEKVAFGDELGVIESTNSVTVMDIGGVEYENNYIIIVFSNYLALHEELTKIKNKSINYLCEKMKHFSVSPGNYQQLSLLNNEVINIQRELYKKNAIISDLFKTKEELNIELKTLNATKDRIFSIIGHDLRGPLANIIQSVNMIAYDKLTYEEFQQDNFFSNLTDSAANSMHLLENLLDWSKIQLGELPFFPKNFILLESIRTVIDLLKGVAAKKRISIVEELEHNPHVYADQRMIEVILRNIISNSIKFTNDDGKLIIKIDIAKDSAKVVVIDNGVGMIKEKIATLFDLNKNNVIRGTKGEKGTGFGLVLCKKLIEQNGGLISISSQNGKGSEFTFTIPLSKI